MAPLIDIVILSLSAFIGNVGVAVTGFGMAILYLFVWQIATLAGYDGADFKYAVFIQALALFSAQPLLLYKAQVFQHASRRMLLYFIPITILATPLGQITGDRVSTDLVEAIGGCLVTFVACFEMYQKRSLFYKWFCGENEPEHKISDTVDESSVGNTIHIRDPISNESSLVATTQGGSQSNDSFDLTYDLGKELGKGSFAVVKIALDKLTQEEYAVKIVDKQALLEVEEAKLKEEISLLQAVDHKNIINLVNVYNEPAYYYLVMEKMQGGDLLDRLTGVSFFSERQAQVYAKQVLQAIEHLHSQKIAHRDVKLENIMLDSDDDEAVLKLVDFGFAKRETSHNCFKTMLGTQAYCSIEILQGKAYSKAVDVWSSGVVLFMLLAGYQPFRGEDDDAVARQILSGKVIYDDKFWAKISDSAKDLINGMIHVNVAERLSASKALAHPWFSMKIQPRRASEADADTPVFFMIGSQRSGSNWLRTMLDEREDLASPHPPHIMRDFMPIIDKFGDLSVETNFQILVDHVTTFVERNQVPWTDKHGNRIKFIRPMILRMAIESCNRVSDSRVSRGDDSPLCPGMYLLSIFDAIMSTCAKVNGKRMWMCKSMGMSKFHDLLLEFYGAKRLRYIYLVRDPRDVAMSFMKTPVGDCHYYPIIKKWTNLQGHALKVLKECPDLIHKVHYESILKEKQDTVKGIYEFIGERRFGGVKRQASVMFMKPTESLIGNAKKGREASKARDLSYQFQNLGRGESFAKNQFQKWKDPETGLQVDELYIVESIAHETMARLGYESHVVGKMFPPKQFSKEELEEFDRLNKLGIEKMYEDLKEENPADYARRQLQASTLTQSASFLQSWDPTEVVGEDSTHDIFGSYLSEDELAVRLSVEPSKTATLFRGQRIRWATATQRGYYPGNCSQPNQDSYTSKTAFVDGIHWFSVLDGHGADGHKCAEMAAKEIPERFAEAVKQGQSMGSALEASHMETHQRMLENEDIDAEQSGTTITSLLFTRDGSFSVSNVGDSTCIMGSFDGGSTEWSAHTLCREHTPFLSDERKRIERSGGVVMTVDQRDGEEPMHQDWSDKHTPPRVWSANRNDKFPGCGFTRSIGDGFAHSLGVIARPEISEPRTLDANTRVLILASDGLTEFLEASEIVRIAQSHRTDPAQAAQALVKVSTDRWLEKGDSIDDTTVTVVFVDLPTSTSLEQHNFAIVEGDEGLSEGSDLESGNMLAMEEKNVSDNNENTDIGPLGPKAQFWTLFAGAASGFLGGLCGIRGPPIILYFLHPPAPVVFEKKEAQRATGASITATNVAMRLAYYLVRTLAFDGEDNFTDNDVSLYICVILSSLAGVFVGTMIFEQIKDAKATIRGVLAIFLMLCGVSLLLSSFSGI